MRRYKNSKKVFQGFFIGPSCPRFPRLRATELGGSRRLERGTASPPWKSTRPRTRVRILVS
eukprot:scaffold1435_cov267-Pinguiococcus_pyrenoidosus.AAC.44